MAVVALVAMVLAIEEQWPANGNNGGDGVGDSNANGSGSASST